ncbi:MAG TPA: YfiR family protein [Phenylobacterium sp.]|nr:YfiR family protein [Phenylobacterium sp.]
MSGLAAMAVGDVTPLSSPRADPHELELAVEATYLYKVAHFVTWPPGVFPNPAAPVMLCIQGADPFGATLDRLVAEKQVGGRPIVVRRLARLEPGSGCQIAFVAGGAVQSQAQALQAVEGAPVLTVTDEQRGTSARGIVQLLLESGKVRFSIDAAQADRSGVAISSKLLALAVAVKR